MNYEIAGVVPSVADLRDIPYVSPFTPDQLAPYLNRSDEVLSVPNQLSAGTCVWNGITNQVEHLGKLNGDNTEYSRMYPYVMTKLYENRMFESGVSPRNAYKVGRKLGFPTEESYPYDLDKEFTVPPESLEIEAFENRIDRYEFIVKPMVLNEDPDQRIHNIRSAIQEGFLPTFAMQVTSSLHGLKGPMVFHDYQKVSATNPPIGGHLMTFIGFDHARNCFIVLNSWGTEWGQGGICYLPYWIVSEPFFESTITRRFKAYTIPEKPGFKLEFINSRRIEIRYTPKAEDVGKKVKIFVGGIIGGEPYMKQPMPAEFFVGPATSINNSYDQWMPASFGYEPVVSDYTLQEDNFIRLVQWMDLKQFSGGEIYCGIGIGDINTAEITKVVTIPVFE